MKKRLSLAAMAMMSMLSASAQLSLYGLDVETSPMTLFTDGTKVDLDFSDENYLGEDFTDLVFDADGTAWYTAIEDATAIPIGFKFRFDDQDMTHFLLGSSGDVYLFPQATVSMPTPKHYNIFTSTFPDAFGVVSINGALGAEGTEIRYKTEGAEGERVLTIQYKQLNISERNFWDTPVAIAKVDLQYRLFEASGNIEMKLNGFKPFDDANMSLQSLKIGLHATGEDRILLSDFYGSATTTKNQITTWTASYYPADGITYLFKAPQPCQTPVVAPTNLSLSANTQSISGSFTVGDADHYLVLVSKDAELTEMPVDKTTYGVYSQIGNAQVVAVASVAAPWFNSPAMFEANTSYNVFVVGYNSQCIDGPLYQTVAPLTGTVTTMAGAPEALTLLSAGASTLKLGVTAVPGFDAFVIMTDKQGEDPWGNPNGKPVFGTPKGVLNVGDEIEGGGKVIYVGGTTSDINLSDLEAQTTYFIRAYSSDGNGRYSSVYREMSAMTALTLPWTFTPTDYANRTVPTGWQPGNSSEDWQIDTRNKVFCNIIEEESEAGIVNSIMTPFIQLAPVANRLQLGISTAGTSRLNTGAMADNDTIRLQLTTDGTTFTDLIVLTKEDGLSASAKTIKHVFYEGAGQAVRFRFVYNRHVEAKTQIHSFMVEAKPDCDYPIDVIVSNVSGTEATIAWTAQGEEDAWQISLKKQDAEEWDEPITVRENPYVVDGLEGLSAYDVRVRAYCSATSQSQWSASASFNTAVTVPFNIEDTGKSGVLTGWGSYEGKLDETLTTGGSLSGSYGLSYSGYTGYSADDWYVSPLLDLGDDPTQTYQFATAFTMGREYTSYYTYLEEGQQIRLAVSRDGELMFKSADVVATLDQSSFPAAEQSGTLEGRLAGYTGKVRLGINVTAPEVGGQRPRDIKFDGISLLLGEKDPTVGISETIAQPALGQPATVYNAAGQQLGAIRRGISIVRRPNGEVRKVVVK